MFSNITGVATNCRQWLVMSVGFLVAPMMLIMFCVWWLVSFFMGMDLQLPVLLAIMYLAVNATTLFCLYELLYRHVELHRAHTLYLRDKVAVPANDNLWF